MPFNLMPSSCRWPRRRLTPRLTRSDPAHLTGGYDLLVQFMVSFSKRIPDIPLYGLFLVPLIVVFVLRMVAMSRRSSAALTPSTP